MAEGRMIKKNISDSDKLAMLSNDSVRLVWVWIYVHADIEGRYVGDPDLIRGRVFPKIKSMTSRKIWKCLWELNQVDLIILYKIKNEVYIQFQRFHDHQSLRRDREAPSKIPKYMTRSRITVGVLQEYSRVKVKYKIKSKIKSKIKVNDIVPLSEISKVDIFLTQLLIDLMKENLPNSHIVKRFEKSEVIQHDWMNQCRLMQKRDERTPKEIETLIRWSQKNEFWKSNILSMAKLRKQFDRLLLQAKKTNYAGIKEWLRECENEQK